MLLTTTRTQTAADAIYTELHNGEAVILHLGTHRYYTLNESGVKIWQLANQGKSVGEIGKALEHQYEVSPQLAEASVVELIEELANEKLVTLI